MFAGHSAYRFAQDPMYKNGFIPTVKELIEALLEGVAKLYVEYLGYAEFQLSGEAADTRTCGIATHLVDEGVALRIYLLAVVLERKDIVEHRVKALNKEVCLQLAKRVVVVGREGERVRTLGAQIGVYLDD